MTEGTNDGDELRELAAENKRSKRRWVRVQRRESIEFVIAWYYATCLIILDDTQITQSHEYNYQHDNKPY
jgi:hypothetical protein